MPLRIRSQRLGSGSLAVLLSMTVAAWPCAAVPPPLTNRPLPQPARGPLADKLAKLMAEAPDLIVDTHGAAVIEPVFDLLAEAYRCFGAKPTLLERDFNFPPIAELVAELDRIRDLQAQAPITAPLVQSDVA